MNDLGSILKGKTENKKLMVAFPHPDDEAMGAGGLLVLAKKYGWKTIVVTLTKGEMGQCYINRNGKTLSQLRSAELKEAVKVLNVDKLILGKFGDATLRKNYKEVGRWVLKILRKEKPGLVVTFDPSGITAHPDHISLSLAVLKTVRRLKDTDLFWVSLPERWNFLINKKTAQFSPKANYSLNLGMSWCKKLIAIKKHKSQRLENKKPYMFLFFAILHREWYYKVDLEKVYKYKFVNFKI